MYISSQTLFTLLISVANARPQARKRDAVTVWETAHATVTTDHVVATEVATAWATMNVPAPSPVAALRNVQQVQVLINEIAAQYTYSSARTVFAIPTVITSTVTQTIQVTAYVTNGVTVTPQATITATNTVDAGATPLGVSAGTPVTATLPLVSALISGATVTIPAQTYTYYAPKVDAIGAAIAASTTLLAAHTMASVTDVNIVQTTSSTSTKGDNTKSTSSSTPLTAPTPSSSSQSTTTTSQTTSSPSSTAQSTSVTASTSTTSAQTSANTAASTFALYNQDSFVSTVLKSINAYRALHSASALTWDYNLAASALTYAQSCTMRPSTDATFGETLAAGTATDPTFYIDLWYNEKSSYSSNTPGFSDSTGHYTQLVWASTTTIGCGFSSGCGEYSNYLVCRYEAPGNVVGGTNNNQYFISNVIN